MVTCILCTEPTDRHHPACLDYEEPAEEPVYNEFCETELEARLVHLLIKLGQGYRLDKMPPFPGDKQASRVKAGTGIFGAVKAAVPVAELARRFTDLQNAGSDRLKGRCPLHEEKTGSFYVFQSNETWRCFGACARGGDVIELARLLMDKALLT